LKLTAIILTAVVQAAAVSRQ